MAKLGFIGLGIMGRPMASHLIAAGHTVHVCDLVTEPVKEMCSAGAHACSCCKDIAQESDIIFIMVPDTPDVKLFCLARMVWQTVSGQVLLWWI